MIKRFKGFFNGGCTILGYRLVPVIDHGEMNTRDFTVGQPKEEPAIKDFNCDKGLRKVTYRKFMKSANRR